MQQEFDIIIIGGGIAGLTASFLFSERTNYSVCLFESSSIGGRASTENIKGFRVDNGIHALLLGQGSTIVRITNNKIKAKESQLSFFDTEKKKVVPLYTKGILNLLKLPFYITPEKIRKIIACGLYAIEDAADIDTEDLKIFFLEALKKRRFVGYPVGGWSKIFETLINVRTKIIKTKVNKIVEKDGRVLGVITEDKKFFKAKCVLAACPPKTVANLLPKNNRTKNLIESLRNIRETFGVSAEIGIRSDRDYSKEIIFTANPPGIFWDASQIDRSVSPPGCKLLYTFSPLDNLGEIKIAERKNEILKILNHLYPEWNSKTVFSRFRTIKVNNARLSKSYPRSVRPKTTTEIEGLFLAGDWVLGKGFGGELSANTGEIAFKLIEHYFENK
mgnify:CR=1 FL=1